MRIQHGPFPLLEPPPSTVAFISKAAHTSFVTLVTDGFLSPVRAMNIGGVAKKLKHPSDCSEVAITLL